MSENKQLLSLMEFEWPKSFDLILRGRIGVTRDESIYMFRSNGRHSVARGDYYYVCQEGHGRLFKFAAWSDDEALEKANRKLAKMFPAPTTQEVPDDH